MRPLTEEETRTFFEKLVKYIGKNIRHLIDRPDKEYCFRYHHDRIYYLSIDLLKEASSCTSDNLVSVGVCFGKFSKTKKFRLHITALPYLAQYARYKLWIKPQGEMSYLYGNNILKAHLGRITDNTPKYAGVVCYSMSDIPLGFGVTAYSTQECRKVESTAIVGFHQSDIGEYLRVEADVNAQSQGNTVGADVLASEMSAEIKPTKKQRKLTQGAASENELINTATQKATAQLQNERQARSQAIAAQQQQQKQKAESQQNRGGKRSGAPTSRSGASSGRGMKRTKTG